MVGICSVCCNPGSLGRPRPRSAARGLLWSGTRSALLGDPNDEAVSGHRLYLKGLADVLWACTVRGSDAVDALERQNRVHPIHDVSRFDRPAHHVLLLKERVVEVIVEAVEVRRTDGAMLEVAVAVVAT